MVETNTKLRASKSYKAMMFRRIILTIGLLTLSNQAQAHDWYEINENAAQCLDMAMLALAFGAPQLASPATTRAYYQSLGDSVSAVEAKDNNGDPLITLIVEDSEGHAINALTFYPSLSDCQNILVSEEKDGTIANPNDMN